jgi:hypothetical protein
MTKARTLSKLLGGTVPSALDTLNEIAIALGNDASLASTITTALAGKVPLVSGSIIQSVSFPSTFIETNCSTRDTWTACGVNAVITPKNANNKILVVANAYMLSYGANANGVVWGMTRLKRGATIIDTREVEGRQVLTGVYYHANAGLLLTCLDSPNTTSQVTYTAEMMLPTMANGQVIQNTLLRSKFGPSDGVGGGLITLMEIAQ